MKITTRTRSLMHVLNKQLFPGLIKVINKVTAVTAVNGVLLLTKKVHIACVEIGTTKNILTWQKCPLSF